MKTIATWLGHSSTKLTLDTYGHLMGTDAERAAIERINRVRGPAGASTDPSSHSRAGHDASGTLRPAEM